MGIRSVLKQVKRKVEYNSKMKEVYKYLLDEESNKILKVITNYRVYKSHERLLNELIDCGKTNFVIRELEKFEGKNLVICGDGDVYKNSVLLLKNSKWKNGFREIEKKYERIADIKENEVAIIISGNRELKKQLKNSFGEKLYVPEHSAIVGEIGKQYFDIFEPIENEVFIDAGAFDGQTELDFINWTKNKYDAMYVFEPIETNFKNCKKLFEKNGIDKITAINKGVWNKEEILYFTENGAGSKIEEDSKCKDANKLCVTSIDSVVGDNVVTYIKMDVEGSELKALEGAKETIKRCSPRMAVCIYHKDEDIYEIPKYILSLNENYRFYIRHYSSFNWETVLYAMCVEWKEKV